MANATFQAAGRHHRMGFARRSICPPFVRKVGRLPRSAAAMEAKVRKAAEAAGVESVHTDPLELLRREDLTAVAISTPPRSHHALVIAALNAGKHVVCEKPFAMDAREAAEMRDVAAQKGRTAMVAHEFRYTPQRAYVKRLLADRYIGRFRMCTIELFLDRYVTKEPRALTWQAFKADGGGLLGALGVPHYIDGLRDWFGDIATASGQLSSLRPDVTDAATGKIAPAETDDTFTMTLNFANGGFATMIASFAATPTRGARIAVMGDEGTLVCDRRDPIRRKTASCWQAGTARRSPRWSRRRSSRRWQMHVTIGWRHSACSSAILPKASRRVIPLPPTSPMDGDASRCWMRYAHRPSRGAPCDLA